MTFLVSSWLGQDYLIVDVGKVYARIIRSWQSKAKFSLGCRNGWHSVLGLDIAELRAWLPKWVAPIERQYFLQRLFAFSRGFEVVLGCPYASGSFPEAIEEAFGNIRSDSSFWIRKVTSG